MPDLDHLVNVPEAAILVGVDASQIHRAIRAGEIMAREDDPIELELREVIAWRVRTARRRPQVEKAVI